MKACLGSYKLNDDLNAFIYDETSHYFGGYYHIKIRLLVEVPVCAHMFDSNNDWLDAEKTLGSIVTFERILEKMAVLESELEVVKKQLITSCETNHIPYLKHADFARRFVNRCYKEKLTKRDFNQRQYNA